MVNKIKELYKSYDSGIITGIAYLLYFIPVTLLTSINAIIVWITACIFSLMVGFLFVIIIIKK